MFGGAVNSFTRLSCYFPVKTITTEIVVSEGEMLIDLIMNLEIDIEPFLIKLGLGKCLAN